MVKSAWITPRLEIIPVNNRTFSGANSNTFEAVGYLTTTSYYTGS